MVEQKVTARANGFERDTSVFSMLEVTGLIPHFRKLEKLLEGDIEKCSGPSAVADSYATG